MKTFEVTIGDPVDCHTISADGWHIKVMGSTTFIMFFVNKIARYEGWFTRRPVYNEVTIATFRNLHSCITVSEENLQGHATVIEEDE